MTRALIGHTGLVGGNLALQGSFDACFNSANFREMEGRSFDEVWCAGIQAVKWWANANAAEDRDRIRALLDVLSTVRTPRFVLISTVDVYRDPAGVDEESPTPETGLHPYGLNRLGAEAFVKDRFPGSLTLRLPGLFGPGLKKNAIYDLVHGGATGSLDGGARFQFYDLSTIHRDADVAIRERLGTVNLATEPVSLAEVGRRVFGLDIPDRGTGVSYDMRTRHAGAFGRPGSHYLREERETVAAIAAFSAAERARIAAVPA